MGDDGFRIQTEVSNPYVSSTVDTNVNVLVKISSSVSTPLVTTPLGSCLVIDKSGSMKGKKLKNIKKAVMDMVDKYDDEDIISIIAFDFKTQILVLPTLANQRKKIKKAVKRIKASGPTSLHTAISEAIDLCKDLEGANSRIIVFTDGYPTDVKEEGKYQSLAMDAFNSGITISTIGVGDEYKDRILRAISDNGGGWWEHISDIDKIKDAFDREFNESKSLVTYQPILKLELNPFCVVKKIHMVNPIAKEMDYSLDAGGNMILRLPSMCLGKPQEYIMEVQIKASNRTGELSVINFKLTDSQRESITSASANIEFTSDQDIIKHYKPRPRAIMELVTIMEQGTRAIELGDRKLALETEEKTKALMNNPTLIKALNSDEEGKTKMIFAATKSIEQGEKIDTKEEIAKLRRGI